MLLYHGSNVEVIEPDLSKSYEFLDFGIGFYLTTNKDQAILFSHKVVLREMKKRKPQGVATVNIYEFEIEKSEDIKILKFEYPSGEWLDYVFKNRLVVDDANEYDIVIGPVANDDVYNVIDQYENGIFTREIAINALKIRKLYDQYAFKSKKALRKLRFISSQCYKEDK